MLIAMAVSKFFLIIITSVIIGIVIGVIMTNYFHDKENKKKGK